MSQLTRMNALVTGASTIRGQGTAGLGQGGLQQQK